MRNVKVLEMLNEGRVDELKKMLSDEIYTESLTSKAQGAKQRYAAMKKYFNYAGSAREVLQKPCEVKYDGKKYISFCNSYSLALTTENCGEMEMLEDPSRYPDVSRLISFNGDENKINFTEVFAEAKSKGYKLKKSEFFCNKYLLRYDDAYFRLMLLDSTYSIIDDGKEATVYHVNGNHPLIIKNNIGVCVVIPIRYDGNPEENGEIVVNVE